MLAEAFESLIGAIYLDSGLSTVRQVRGAGAWCAAAAGARTLLTAGHPPPGVAQVYAKHFPLPADPMELLSEEPTA